MKFKKFARALPQTNDGCYLAERNIQRNITLLVFFLILKDITFANRLPPSQETEVMQTQNVDNDNNNNNNNDDSDDDDDNNNRRRKTTLVVVMIMMMIIIMELCQCQCCFPQK